MNISGFNNIKKYFNFVKKDAGAAYISYHKLNDGTRFAIICTNTYAQAICYNKQRIEDICLAMFEIKHHPDGYKYLHLTSIKSRDTKKGIGTEMINVLKHHGIKNGCKYIKLLSVESAKEFYSKLGFTSDDDFPSRLTNFSFNLQKIAKCEIKDNYNFI